MSPDQPAPSKSQKKRNMLALQALGERLVGLSPQHLERIPLPSQLRDAVLTARSISARGGRRRQLQYVGKLMREVDPAPIAEALAALDAGDTRARAALHQAERWRSELLTDPTALERLLAAHPHADPAPLRTLAAAARAERDAARPPRRQRELLRALRALLDGPPAT